MRYLALALLLGLAGCSRASAVSSVFDPDYKGPFSDTAPKSDWTKEGALKYRNGCVSAGKHNGDSAAATASLCECGLRGLVYAVTMEEWTFGSYSSSRWNQVMGTCIRWETDNDKAPSK